MPAQICKSMPYQNIERKISRFVRNDGDNQIIFAAKKEMLVLIRVTLTYTVPWTNCRSGVQLRIRHLGRRLGELTAKWLRLLLRRMFHEEIHSFIGNPF